MGDKAHMQKLPSAPLQEVITEVRWGLEYDPKAGTMTDAGFQLALGKFHGLVQDAFPIARPLHPADVPPALLANRPTHQFWTGERQWPVLQLGPGILTVNDTEANYEWQKSYLPLIRRALGHLEQAYGQMRITEFSLRYIDAVKVNGHGFKDWQSFLQESLNFSFANDFNTRGPLRDFQLRQSFDLAGGDGGMLTIDIANGRDNQLEDILVWQTCVQDRGNWTVEQLAERIVKAHDCASPLFKELCKPAFYGKFTV
ncbi:MAG: TIGR04255 family protein [Flavobacteriales bacterium]|nr:TIGR04255 family protein [Flavobacteriales bacterium]